MGLFHRFKTPAKPMQNVTADAYRAPMHCDLLSLAPHYYMLPPPGIFGKCPDNVRGFAPLPRRRRGEAMFCLEKPIEFQRRNQQVVGVEKSIAIIGDFNPENRTHRATNDALRHGAASARMNLHFEWIGTEVVVEADGFHRLASFDGLWIAPASPYKSMEGALRAIRAAREGHRPLLGTCGGFQHIVLEYARNVLGISGAEHEETSPGASQLFISRLDCSLAGRTMAITLKPPSLVARLYGRTEVTEEYYCNFGVNPAQLETLFSRDLRVVGSDAEGVARAVELPGHPLFVGTLFLPQLNSTAQNPHPLVAGFLQAVAGRA